MRSTIDIEDLKDIAIDLEAIEALLIHLESSGYFIDGQDGLTFRAIKGSVRYTRTKIEDLMKEDKQ